MYFLSDRKMFFSNFLMIQLYFIPSHSQFSQPTLKRIAILKAEIEQINTSLCQSQTGVSTTQHFAKMFTQDVIV